MEIKSATAAAVMVPNVPVTVIPKDSSGAAFNEGDLGETEEA
jgi:hypothetical protein